MIKEGQLMVWTSGLCALLRAGRRFFDKIKMLANNAVSDSAGKVDRAQCDLLQPEEGKRSSLHAGR
ncbi:MAG: hypothetical protein RIQ56_154 [Candidatus Parcubacteria bacterium]|jgi:hypothetical protein